MLKYSGIQSWASHGDVFAHMVMLVLAPKRWTVLKHDVVSHPSDRLAKWGGSPNEWMKACMSVLLQKVFIYFEYFFYHAISMMKHMHRAWNFVEYVMAVVGLISLLLRQILLNYLRLTLVQCHSQVDAAGSECRTPQSSICGGLPTLRPRQKINVLL